MDDGNRRLGVPPRSLGGSAYPIIFQHVSSLRREACEGCPVVIDQRDLRRVAGNCEDPGGASVGAAQARGDIDSAATGSSYRHADAMRMRWGERQPVVGLGLCRDPPRCVRGRCWLQPGR